MPKHERSGEEVSQPIEHSPGPWRVKDGCIFDSSGFPVVSPMGGSEPGDQTEANLRLIAEAPEMLAIINLLRHEHSLMRAAGLLGTANLLKRLEGGQ